MSLKVIYKSISGAIFGLFLFFFFFVLFHNPGISLTRAKEISTKSLLSKVRFGCEAYQSEYGALPSSPENPVLFKILTTDNPRKIAFIESNPKYLNAKHELTDAWGTPLQVIFYPSQTASMVSTVSLISAGPDLVFDTKDDLRTDQ